MTKSWRASARCNTTNQSRNDMNRYRVVALALPLLVLGGAPLAFLHSSRDRPWAMVHKAVERALAYAEGR
jgi:hypothetical protein